MALVLDDMYASPESLHISARQQGRQLYLARGPASYSRKHQIVRRLILSACYAASALTLCATQDCQKAAGGLCDGCALIQWAAS